MSIFKLHAPAGFSLDEFREQFNEVPMNNGVGIIHVGLGTDAVYVVLAEDADPNTFASAAQDRGVPIVAFSTLTPENVEGREVDYAVLFSRRPIDYDIELENVNAVGVCMVCGGVNTHYSPPH